MFLCAGGGREMSSERRKSSSQPKNLSPPHPFSLSLSLSFLSIYRETSNKHTCCPELRTGPTFPATDIQYSRLTQSHSSFTHQRIHTRTFTPTHTQIRTRIHKHRETHRLNPHYTPSNTHTITHTQRRTHRETHTQSHSSLHTPRAEQ